MGFNSGFKGLTFRRNMLLHLQDDEVVCISNKLESSYTLYGIETLMTTAVILSYFLRTLLPAEQYITIHDPL